MKSSKSTILILAALIGIGIAPAFADKAVLSGHDVDNSGTNIRDRDMRQPTADQASNQESDIEMMAGIRSALTKDDSLSTYAKNTKIIAENGRVTLKGPVESAAEKTKIEALAQKIAGKANVTSMLEVKAAN